MTDQLITIHGGAYVDVKKALTQWVALYATALGPNYRFELYKQDRGQHLIRVDARVDNERLFYLVNYLCYPEGIHYQVVVEGFARWRDMDVMVFIPKDEKGPDNVYVMTAQKEAYKIDFGGKVTKVAVVRDFSPPDFDPASMPPPDLIHPMLHAEKHQENSTIDDLERRFKLILLIIGGLFLLSYVVVSDSKLFLTINGGIGAAVGLWLFIDYQLLQSRNFYILSLLLAIPIQLYGYFLALRFSSGARPVPFVQATLIPFLLLALQFPCRYLFKLLMKREPVVDKPAPSVADFFYMATLLMGVIGFFMWLD